MLRDALELSALRLHGLCGPCQEVSYSTKRPFNTWHYFRLDMCLHSLAEGSVADNAPFGLPCPLTVTSVQELMQLHAVSVVELIIASIRQAHFDETIAARYQGAAE